MSRRRIIWRVVIGWLVVAIVLIIALLVFERGAHAATGTNTPPIPTSLEYPTSASAPVSPTAIRGVTSTRNYVWNGTVWVEETQPGAGPGSPLTDTQLRASPVVVQISSGSVTVSSVVGTVSVSGPLTDAQLRASPVPVSGTVGISGTVPVSGAFWQATQPVSLTSTTITGSVAVTGPLTDTQLRATPVPVSGTVTVTDGAGALNVIIDSGTTVVTQPTGTNLHAVIDTGSTTAVTGNVTAVQATGTNLHTVVDSGAITVSGTVTTTPPSNASTNVTQFGGTNVSTGTGTGGAGIPRVTVSSDSFPATVAVTGPLTDTQLRATPVPVSGTVTVTDGAGALNVIVDSGTTVVTQPTGTNLHAVIDTGSTTAVTGNVTAVQATGTNLHAVVDSGAITVSGTVTANAGTNLNTSALALDATLTGRTQKAQITDGTRDGTVKAASTLPLLTDTAVVTTQRDPLPAGTNVIGHAIIDTGSTTAVTGNVTAVQGTGTNLHTVVDSGSITATQATGTNLHAVIDTGSTTAVTALPVGHNIIDSGTTTVTQATGTNLHSVVDSGSITATQATGTNLHTVVDSGAITVSGTVTTTPPANASTNVTQFGGTNVSTGTGTGGAGIPRVTVSSDSFPATVAVTGPLTDTQLRATPVPVSGSVAVSNFPATQPVSAVALPLPSGAATETGNLATLVANQTNGTEKVQSNLTSVAGWPVQTGKGISGPGIPRVTVSSDSFPANPAIETGGNLAAAVALLQQSVNNLGAILGNQTNGAEVVSVVSSPTRFPINPFLPRCNAVRRSACQP